MVVFILSLPLSPNIISSKKWKKKLDPIKCELKETNTGPHKQNDTFHRAGDDEKLFSVPSCWSQEKTNSILSQSMLLFDWRIAARAVCQAYAITCRCRRTAQIKLNAKKQRNGESDNRESGFSLLFSIRNQISFPKFPNGNHYLGRRSQTIYKLKMWLSCEPQSVAGWRNANYEQFH